MSSAPWDRKESTEYSVERVFCVESRRLGFAQYKAKEVHIQQSILKCFSGPRPQTPRMVSQIDRQKDWLSKNLSLSKPTLSSTLITHWYH